MLLHMMKDILFQVLDAYIVAFNPPSDCITRKDLALHLNLFS